MGYLAKSTSPTSSFFFQPVTEAEVRLEILSIHNGEISRALFLPDSDAKACAPILK